MPSQLESYVSIAPRRLCGMMGGADAAIGEQVRRLSLREQALFGWLRRNDRKASWLRGRILTKYLYLIACEGEGDAEESIAPIHVGHRDLRRYSDDRYRAVEVLSGRMGDAPTPVLWLEDMPVDTPSVSISHCSGTSFAAISRFDRVGIDIENAMRRVPAFYRMNFTATERAWTAVAAREEGLDPVWLYTLLWTIKEGVIKASASSRLTLWDMPSISVEMPGSRIGLRDCLNIGNSLSQALCIGFDVDVKGTRRHVTAMLTGTAQMALCMITWGSAG